ncbi:XrtA/PEP-CTERM system-associated ATPase [Novosphingobium sp. RD2P27]|uniref:XrtA/PEP-CTERM system-associated ATPase n=1 Tax=Novosphingobium kalidii TaxID=3230299 RepID=A0ABV2CYW4_9SPHN
MFDEFYGLEARPFQLTPDPAFYFESVTHRKALSYLGYGLAQGEGFVVITGEVGAGKSTLVAHLMATIDPVGLTAAQVVTSALDGEEIIHVVARAFGLEVAGHDKATALGAIEHFFHEEARCGRRCLLIVDEAQNLSIAAIEELRMLSNFQLGAHPLLQTLLLGQPEFRAMLLDHPELEQLRQRVIATHHLEPMQMKEVQPYIEHRMKRAGWQGNPSFDPRVFAEIYTATGGIPRRINQTLNRLLLLGAVEERAYIDGAMLDQVLGELNEDGSIAIVSPQKQNASLRSPSTAVPETDGVAAGHSDQHDAPVAAVVLDAMLAERDAQIHELQQAVIELANAADERHEARQAAYAGLVEDISRQIAALEGQLSEQDRTVRHALTMIIEWIESDEALRAAA